MTQAYQISPASCTDGRYSPKEVFDTPWVSEPDWIYEVKSDGIRYLLQIYPNGSSFNYLTSRRISKVTQEFVEKQDKCPHIRDFPFPGFLRDTIFDGEILSSSGGISSDTQHAMVTGDVYFMCWDILMLRGSDLRDLPLRKRKEILEKFFNSVDTVLPPWMKLSSCDSDPVRLLKKVLSEKGEGIVGKDLSKPYYQGWLKVKESDTYDVIITGYEDSTSDKYGSQGWIKAVKFGQYRDGEMVDLGQTSGMTEEVRKDISENREKYLGTIIEIEADYRFPKTGKFRHPRFIRFRYDKNSSECIWNPSEVPDDG